MTENDLAPDPAAELPLWAIRGEPMPVDPVREIYTRQPTEADFHLVSRIRGALRGLYPTMDPSKSAAFLAPRLGLSTRRAQRLCQSDLGGLRRERLRLLAWVRARLTWRQEDGR
jgi:hypothetical protein